MTNDFFTFHFCQFLCHLNIERKKAQLTQLSRVLHQNFNLCYTTLVMAIIS